MADTRLARVARLLSELSVVFFGVLIALAADSWWQGRADLALEAEYLASLETDMVRARDDLAAMREQLEAATELADSVIASLTGADQPADVWSGVGIFALLPPSIPTGTLEALVQTGDINLLRDPDLRAVAIREAGALRNSLEVFRQLIEMSLRAAEAWNLASETVRATQGLPAGEVPGRYLWRDAAAIASYQTYRASLGSQRVGLGELSGSVEELLEAIAAARAR